MGESMITRRGGGGGKLNALVEQYKVAAGGSVSANGFVKFVDYLSTHSLQYNRPYVSACALDGTTVLVTDKKISAESNSKYIYCRQITFAAGTATVGTATQVASSTYGQENTSLMRLVRINATTAVLFFANYYNDNYWKYAVITLADGAISSGGTKTLEYVWAVVPDNEDVYSWDVIPIGDDKFIWLDCAYNSKLYLYARVFKCDASQNVITEERKKSISSLTGTSNELAIVASKLSNGRYAVLREYSTSGSGPSRPHYVQLFTVMDSGSAISISTATQLFSLGTSTSIFCYALGIIPIVDDKLLYIYIKREGTGTTGYLYGRVITVPTNGTATAGTETQLSTQQFAFYSSTSYDYNHVLRGGHGGIFRIETGYQIILKPNASEPIYAIDVSVSKDTITPTSEKLVIALDTTQDTSIQVRCDIVQPNNDMRIIYTTIDGVLTGTMLSTAIDAATSGTVDGVAKTSASAGETVDVYRPA